jgi:hypothetical protein
LLAYTGPGRLEEDGRFVTEVMQPGIPSWAGFQERFFSIKYGTFTVRTGRQTHPSFRGETCGWSAVAERASD